MKNINDRLFSKRYSNVTGDPDMTNWSNQKILDYKIAQLAKYQAELTSVRKTQQDLLDSAQGWADSGDWDMVTQRRNQAASYDPTIASYTVIINGLKQEIPSYQALVDADVLSAQAHANDQLAQSNMTPEQKAAAEAAKRAADLAAQKASDSAALAQKQLAAQTEILATTAANRSRNIKIIVIVGSVIALLIATAVVIKIVKKNKAKKQAA